MTSVNPTRTSFSSTSCLAALGWDQMVKEGESPADKPPQIHPPILEDWERFHHKNAPSSCGDRPTWPPKLLHDTLYRPGSYRGDPPRHKAVKGCTRAIGTGKRTPPGGNDLIPQRMPLRVPPPQSIPLNQTGPWAAHHRNPIPINLLQYPANGLNHCLPHGAGSKERRGPLHSPHTSNGPPS